MSKIEWTGKTWNPLSGCSRKSAGCQNCYAEVMTKRLEAMGQEKYTGLLNEQERFNGVIKFDEKALLKPLSIKKPTTFFVNSMSDLFHENVKDEWIDKAFAVMAMCPQHIFQVLTKRPERMREYLLSKVGLESREETIMREAAFLGNIIWDSRGNRKELYRNSKNIENRRSWVGFPLPNVWLGVSVENQKTADERIPLLLETPAAVRFLSCEPLLEEVNLEDAMPLSYGCGGASPQMSCEVCRSACGIDWVIVGGESGHGARPCDIAWIRSIVHQCKDADVPVFVKQLGAKPYFGNWSSCGDLTYDVIVDDYDRRSFIHTKNKKGGDLSEFPKDLQVREFPK